MAVDKKEYKKQWYQANKERIREKNTDNVRKWRVLNKARDRGHYMKWKSANKEKIRTSNRKYFSSPRGRFVQAAYHYRRKTQSIGLTKDLIQLVYEENILRFGKLTCELCYKDIKFGEDSIEHFIPLSRGGNNYRENLGIAHRKCNSSKGNKTLEEYYKWL